jgi:hypothetical protein
LNMDVIGGQTRPGRLLLGIPRYPMCIWHVSLHTCGRDGPEDGSIPRLLDVGPSPDDPLPLVLQVAPPLQQHNHVSPRRSRQDPAPPVSAPTKGINPLEDPARIHKRPAPPIHAVTDQSCPSSPAESNLYAIYRSSAPAVRSYTTGGRANPWTRDPAVCAPNRVMPPHHESTTRPAAAHVRCLPRE